MMFKHIQYEITNGRAIVTLNRPEKHNALSLLTQFEIAEAAWEADNNKDIHCLILKGAGPSFCSGYDLSEYQQDAPRSQLQSVDGHYRSFRSQDDDAWQLERAQRYRMALFDMHKPSIAQVHGHCLAGGTDLALLCDMVIASDNASFGFPPARDLGSLPNQMWLYHTGPQWAKRLLLTGDMISGTEAQEIGLVMKAVPQAVLESEVQQLADRLSQVDPDLLSANKRSINLGLELMGARTLQRLAAEIDARAHNTSAARDFRHSVKENGLKSTLKRRDEKFGDGRASVFGPELRDEHGHLSSEDSRSDHLSQNK